MDLNVPLMTFSSTVSEFQYSFFALNNIFSVLSSLVSFIF